MSVAFPLASYVLRPTGGYGRSTRSSSGSGSWLACEGAGTGFRVPCCSLPAAPLQPESPREVAAARNAEGARLARTRTTTLMSCRAASFQRPPLGAEHEEPLRASGSELWVGGSPAPHCSPQHGTAGLWLARLGQRRHKGRGNASQQFCPVWPIWKAKNSFFRVFNICVAKN